MSAQQAREISVLRSKVISAANEGFFQYCALELGGDATVTEDNLQVAWDIVRDEGHPSFDSLDRIEFLMAVEEEFDREIYEDEFIRIMRSGEYNDVNSILLWIENHGSRG